MKKCQPIYRDSNSQPLENECPPITTRPGLLPTENKFLKFKFLKVLLGTKLLLFLATCVAVLQKC